MDTSSGGGFGGGMSMGAIFWLQTLAFVMNQLGYPDKAKIGKFLEDIKEKKISEEVLQDLLAFSLNTAVTFILSEKERATENKTVSEFFKTHYNRMIGEKIVLKSNFHSDWVIEFRKLEDAPAITVYTGDKKAIRKIPSILTDYTFTQKVLTGEEVDPLLAMLKPNVGTFSITHAIMAWMTIIEKFSNVVMIATIDLLYRKELLDQLHSDLTKKIDSLLQKQYGGE
jgi:hypothetical protein